MSIYFLKYETLTKIGFSDDVRARVQSVRNGIPVPIEFLGWMPGGKEVEAHFHTLFAEVRRRGEWFDLPSDTMAMIRLLLIPNLPEEKAPRAGRDVVQAGHDQWNELSEQLRLAAASRWPVETHKSRRERLTREFGWGDRRLRAIYDGHGHGRLLPIEAETIKQFARHWITPEMAASTTKPTTTKAVSGQATNTTRTEP